MPYELDSDFPLIVYNSHQAEDILGATNVVKELNQLFYATDTLEKFAWIIITVKWIIESVDSYPSDILQCLLDTENINELQDYVRRELKYDIEGMEKEVELLLKQGTYV